MFIFQFSGSATRKEAAQSPAQKKVQGFFTALRSRFLSAAKGIFSK